MNILPVYYSDDDLLARWEEFFETSENRLKVMEVADRYPEVRSVFISYNEIDIFDTDMAAQLLDSPDAVLEIGEKAIRKLVQQGRSGEFKIHLRIKELPKNNKIEIRLLRSEHLGKMISVEGLVRKATEVRPKLVEAHFKCFRCPAIIVEPQESLFFKEPLECYKEQNGCGRTAGSTKFSLLTEDSKYIDTQKIEIQENPEGLRGGAQPERLTAYLEDDLAGRIAPGDRISLNGVLRSIQKGDKVKSTLFDIHLDVHSIESKEQEYEEVEITEEDEKRIVEEARSEDIFEKIVKSISPTIKGFDEVKESIALQLFGGSAKQLDDGTKVRGDIHILLVGDPGVAKCVTGDSQVMLKDGSTRAIKDIVEEGLAKGNVQKVDDGVHAEIDLGVMTFSWMGAIEPGKAIRVWKRTAPEKMLKFTTQEGRSITVTPTHPLFVQNGTWIAARQAKHIYKGQAIGVSTGRGKWGRDESTVGYQRGLDWDMVTAVEEVPPPEPFVYDLEIKETHIFIANEIINHNSQLLRYMSHLAPRGIYASGKSSSAAGLCVAPDSLIEIDGEEVKIGEFVESRMTSPTLTEEGEWKQSVRVNGVGTMGASDEAEIKPVTSVFRLTTPSFLVELTSDDGRTLCLTSETKVLLRNGDQRNWTRSADIIRDDEVMMKKDGGMGWGRISEKRLINRGLPKNVYDLTVEGAHCFVANGFLVHNTAAAVKDEFGEGRWTLEAGALVLADRGIACIEENQLVVTSKGLKKIREIRPGETVFNYSNGLKTATVKNVLMNGVKPTITVRLYSGDSIRCTKDHLILTESGWKQAGELGIGEGLKVPSGKSQYVMSKSEMHDIGFIHGFALCNMSCRFEDEKNYISFSSSNKNLGRSEYVISLLRKYYEVDTGHSLRGSQHLFVKGHDAFFGPTIGHHTSSRSLKHDLNDLFHDDRVNFEDIDYCHGFLSAIISTDCCISHKRGMNGIKHVIDIVIGRKKYGPDWRIRKQKMIQSMFVLFGIQSTIRGKKVRICSLESYNKTVDVFGNYLFGKNESKLIRAEPKKKTSSFDQHLDTDYQTWFKKIKFDTSATVRLGLRSRIYRARNGGKLTRSFMATLRENWQDITREEYREPGEDYFINPVTSIEESGDAIVYDLTINGEPNFLLPGAIVHNCIDELDKMTDQDRSSMHEAMESQCYDDQTQILTAQGWKFFRDLKEEDLVASLSKHGNLQFVQPTNYIESEYSGEMRYIRSRGIDLAVTPNHKLYCAVKDKENFAGFDLVRLDEIREGSKLYFKKNATWTPEAPLDLGGIGFEPPVWLNFLATYIAHGSVEYCDGRPETLVMAGRDEEDTDRLETCMALLGLSPVKEDAVWKLSDPNMAAVMANLGDGINRRVPQDVFDLPSEQIGDFLNRLLTEMGAGDDWEEATVGTNAKKLADDIQELSLRAGWQTDIETSFEADYIYDSGKGLLKHRPNRYRIRVSKGPKPISVNIGGKRNRVHTANYQGMIYCVEVPEHVIFVRRNGIAVWCGNSITVAKAGITATLQSRTCVLGAANPKYGRFDENESLVNQINMPPALLSRFDLIFALLDKPNQEKDARIAEHIIRGHARGAVIKQGLTSSVEGVDIDEIMNESESFKPYFEQDFMRKYVKYAKRITPILSKDAQKMIMETYLAIRKQGEGPNASVPITARQLEAFIRLSEASARIRLSPVVMKEDALRSVRIVQYYLNKMAKDSGGTDVDKIMTGTTRSDRNRISIVRSLIHDNSDPRKGCPEHVLLEKAEERKMSEQEVRDVLKKMKSAGEVYESSSGHVKFVGND